MSKFDIGQNELFNLCLCLLIDVMFVFSVRRIMFNGNDLQVFNFR